MVYFSPTNQSGSAAKQGAAVHPRASMLGSEMAWEALVICDAEEAPASL